MPEYGQSDVDTLVAKMAAERTALLAAAEALSDADADRVPADAEGEEQWTAKEQLAHLWEMEHAYLAWVRAAIAQDGVAVDGIRGEPVAIPIEAAPQHSLGELVAALRAERGANRGLHRIVAARALWATRQHPRLRRPHGHAVAALLLPPRPAAHGSD